MITKTSSRKTIRLRVAAVCTLIIVSLFFVSSPGNAQNLIGVVIHPQRTIDGTQELGEHPYVEIDKKQASSDMLEKISSGCIKSTSIFKAPQSVKKFGKKAADGAVIITTHHQKIEYITATERENLEKERAITSGFYHRITLKNEDGSNFDKFIVKLNGGSMSSFGTHDTKVGFVIDKTVYTEDQVKEVEAYLHEHPASGETSVVSSAEKIVGPPGVDLSPFRVVFFFISKTNGKEKAQ